MNEGRSSMLTIKPRTLFSRFLLVFSLILLANLILAAALTLNQTRQAVADELKYQLSDAAARAVDDYQRGRITNLSNAQWAANTNQNAGNLAGIEVSAYEPPGGITQYDPQNGWSDQTAAGQIGDRAELVLAGQRVFWMTSLRAFLAVPVRLAGNQWAILMLSLPRSNPAVRMADYGRPVWLTLLAVSLPTLLLAFLFFRQMTRPVSRMVEMADAIAGGDFKKRTSYTSNNEIGALGSALNQMAGQLGAENQARTLLISGISHDLRTPLTSIKANTQAMLDGIILPEETRPLLQDTIAEIDRLRGLVDNLLLAAGQSGEWPLHKTQLNLADLVQRTVAQMQIMAEQAGQTLVTFLPENLEARVDGQQIRQMLVNLIDNAIRYSPPGKMITIRLSENNGWISLVIEDQGFGIPAELRPSVFEPLVKSCLSTGSGLGLYLCRRIVQAHQGHISLASAEPAGTTVTVSLPASVQV
jgi:two-component system, OmpR family, sensor histidine kinase BaeS